MSKDLLGGDYVNISVFYIFLVFKHDFITCIAFTRITASNAACDDATN